MFFYNITHSLRIHRRLDASLLLANTRSISSRTEQTIFLCRTAIVLKQRKTLTG